VQALPFCLFQHQNSSSSAQAAETSSQVLSTGLAGFIITLGTWVGLFGLLGDSVQKAFLHAEKSGAVEAHHFQGDFYDSSIQLVITFVTVICATIYPDPHFNNNRSMLPFCVCVCVFWYK